MHPSIPHAEAIGHWIESFLRRRQGGQAGFLPRYAGRGLSRSRAERGIGVAFAGLLLSLLLAKETRQYAKLEAQLHHTSAAAVSVGENGRSTSHPSMREIFAQA